MARQSVSESQVRGVAERIKRFNAATLNAGTSKVGVENFIQTNVGYDLGRDMIEKQVRAVIGQAMGIKVGNESAAGEVSQNQMEAAVTQNHTNAQIRAAANIMAVAQHGKPGLEAYHRQAIANVGAAREGVTDIGIVQVGSHGYNSMPAGEYFNNNAELDKHVGASIDFNLQAARQNDEWEHMFPTVTLDPSEIGMEVDINLLYVHQQVRHAMNRKDNMPYKRRNIMDAVTDPTVFDDNTIKFHPYFKEDPQGDYREYFVPETLKQPSFPVSDSHSVRTNPLRFGTGEKPLLSLSAHPGATSATSRDETDEFDPRFRMQDLYVLISGQAQDPTKDEGQLVHFSTLNLPKSAFQLAQEGNRRTLLLHFREARFNLTGARKDVAGNEVVALADVKDGEYMVTFTVEVNAEINLQDGLEKHARAFLTVEKIYDKDGTEIDAKTGAGKTLLEGFKLTPYGYNWAATLSNGNRRSRGTILDNQAEAERYKTTLQSPITMQKPVNSGAAPEESQVANLILAARMRNNAQAGTKLLNYEETLAEVYAGHVNKYEVASIEGVGRWYVHPWYEQKTFDAKAQVSALQSSDIPGQLRIAILNMLRDQVNRAFLESRFEPALQVYSKYTVNRPTVGILTDPVLRNWLWMQGDTRSLGEGFNFYIDHTYDERFLDTIRWYFSTTSEGFHALHFGAFLWVSELVTATSMSRDSRIADELTVQPRCEHIVNCPIMGRIDVVNLSEYITSPGGIVTNAKTALEDAIDEEEVPVGPVPGTP